MVTLALGTIAPDGSVTLPTTDPYNTCAGAGEETTCKQITSRRALRSRRKSVFLCEDIRPLPKHLRSERRGPLPANLEIQKQYFLFCKKSMTGGQPSFQPRL